MIIPELKQLQLKNEAVSVYRDCAGAWITGLICKVTENITAMHLFEDYGPYDELTIFETHQISDLTWGNREHQSITKQIAGTQMPKTPKINDSEFQAALLNFNEQYDSLCIYTDNDEENFHLGTIVKVDDTWMKLETLGNMKTLSKSYRIFLRESVTRFSVNGTYHTAIENLHKPAP